MEAIANKDKLKQLQVDVGAGKELQIVTNAPNVVEGCLCVVATVGQYSITLLCLAQHIASVGEVPARLTRMCHNHAHRVESNS